MILHHTSQFFRCAKEPDDPVCSGEDKDIQYDRHDPEKGKRGQDTFSERFLIFLSEADREDRAASHGKSQEDGSEKGHQGKSGSHGGKCIRPEKPADDQRVGDIIALLQQVAQDHGNGEAQHGLHDRSVGQFILHFSHTAFQIICK